MKFVIRRAVVAIIATPVIAGAWVGVIALLIAYGATPTATPLDTFANGLWLGGLAGVAFTFAPQLKNLVR